MSPTRPVIVYIVCHQPKYLDLVFAGLARQSRRPDLVVASSDTDHPGVGELARQWAPLVRVPIAWVRRAHHGIARCSQVRNNAARHVIHDLGIRAGRLIQLDGDILASDTLVERHADLGGPDRLVYPHRVDVPREESQALDARRVLQGAQAPTLSPEALSALESRDRRYRRHLLLRRLRLAPLHKPKLLGCNWSAPIELWNELNGFDEHYQGWGYLDDEFARRAARAGAPCLPACRDIIAFHLWHTTRQPEGPLSANPNHQRFIRRDLPIACEQGLRDHIPQNPVSVDRFEP
ncbi:MAG: galactosyltransferase-related protein [Planctomycetota bacterium]|nr:galactosyltransferase-related protein [Planctomycetota bacterium]